MRSNRRNDPSIRTAASLVWPQKTNKRSHSGTQAGLPVARLTLPDTHLEFSLPQKILRLNRVHLGIEFFLDANSLI